MFLQRLGGDVEVVALQRTDLTAAGVSEEAALERIHLVEDGRAPRTGADAILTALTRSGRVWARGLGRAGRVVPSAVSERVYDLVAANRYRLPGGSAACRIEDRA